MHISDNNVRDDDAMWDSKRQGGFWGLENRDLQYTKDKSMARKEDF